MLLNKKQVTSNVVIQLNVFPYFYRIFQLGGTKALWILYHFLASLTTEYLDNETKSKLYNSASLIITKAEGVTSDDRVIKKLKGTIAGYKKKVIVTKKEYCLEVLRILSSISKFSFSEWL